MLGCATRTTSDSAVIVRKFAKPVFPDLPAVLGGKFERLDPAISGLRRLLRGRLNNEVQQPLSLSTL